MNHHILIAALVIDTLLAVVYVCTLEREAR
jgi:hypothetical protein